MCWIPSGCWTVAPDFYFLNVFLLSGFCVSLRLCLGTVWWCYWRSGIPLTGQWANFSQSSTDTGKSSQTTLAGIYTCWPLELTDNNSIPAVMPNTQYVQNLPKIKLNYSYVCFWTGGTDLVHTRWRSVPQ